LGAFFDLPDKKIRTELYPRTTGRTGADIQPQYSPDRRGDLIGIWIVAKSLLNPDLPDIPMKMIE
jgi:hypothetical protein